MFEIHNEKYISIAAEKELLLQDLCPRFKTIGEILYLFDKKFSHANKNPMAILEFNRYLRTVHLVQPTTTLIEKSPKIVNTFQTIYCMPE
jgi:hypothetical protein